MNQRLRQLCINLIFKSKDYRIYLFSRISQYNNYRFNHHYDLNTIKITLEEQKILKMNKFSYQNPLNIILFITLLLTLLSHTQCQQSCQSCVQMVYYSCNICYDNCTQNISSQFKTCNYTYCSDYSYDQNGTATCVGWDWKYLPQNQCFGTCCHSQQNYFTKEELLRCEQENNKLRTIGIIVGSVLGGIFLLVFFGCLIKATGCSCLGPIGNCIGDCCSCFWSGVCYLLQCKCCKRDPQSANNIPKQPSHLHIQPVKPTEQLKWQQQPVPNKIINDDDSNCTICLQNRVNALTKCGHYYHIQCILQWFNRNAHCPLCNREDVHSVQLFCRGCCTRFVRLELKRNNNVEEIMRNVKGPNCPTCQ